MATVLVVDDDADIRELISVNLSMDGHRVLVASNGDEALALVAADRPDAMVLDVMMPGRDGFAVLAEIKASPVTADIPVLMLTARVDTLDRLRGGIEGAVRYVTKPFSVVALRRALTEVLAGPPEPVLRRRVQTDALAELARLESGRPLPPAGAPRPRLTRYEATDPKPAKAGAPAAPSPVERYRHELSPRQNELLDAVLAAPSLRTAAERLGVSRTYLYAGLRRIARRVGAPSGPELVRALRGAGSGGDAGGGDGDL